MNPKTKTLLLLCLASVVGLSAARAEINVDVTADIRLGRALPPPPPEVVVVEQVGPPGPPPWARSHWYRRSHAYYYYPGSDVYYRPADRVWFYLDGGNWRIGAQLPTSIRVDFGHSVPLTLESDRPYVYHEKVITYYPANYFTRVQIRGPHDVDHHDRNDRDDHDHDHGKHGKGHGKDRRN